MVWQSSNKLRQYINISHSYIHTSIKIKIKDSRYSLQNISLVIPFHYSWPEDGDNNIVLHESIQQNIQLSETSLSGMFQGTENSLNHFLFYARNGNSITAYLTMCSNLALQYSITSHFAKKLTRIVQNHRQQRSHQVPNFPVLEQKLLPAMNSL